MQHSWFRHCIKRWCLEPKQWSVCMCVCFQTMWPKCVTVLQTHLQLFKNGNPKKEWWPSRESMKMRGTMCVFTVLTSQPEDASKIQIWFWFSTSRFLQHFALSSVSQEPIMEQHLGALLPSAEATLPVSSFPRDQVRSSFFLLPLIPLLLFTLDGNTVARRSDIFLCILSVSWSSTSSVGWQEATKRSCGAPCWGPGKNWGGDEDENEDF